MQYDAEASEVVMATKFDTKAIMTRAHEIARWRKFSSGNKPYADVFKEALQSAWYAAKQQALRVEQNRNGVPLASCAFDYRRPVSRFIGRREIAAIGA
jgi:hypothetical protein